jgi:glycosyltransferase involved in cell wall biosynthesis
MNKEPVVSVIIPTYNRTHLVGRAIQSVLNQTYQDFELIVVDDASKDNTKEKIKEFQKKDSRIIYLKHNINKGGSSARNTGIKAAKGRYIAFLDSDDEYVPDNLEERCKARENIPDCYGVIYDQLIKKTPLGDLILPERGIKEGESVIRYLFIHRQQFQTNTLFINKEIFTRYHIFFDEKLNKHQDWDLAINLGENTKFYFLNKTLSIWHAEAETGRVSRQKDYSASFYLIQKYKNQFEKEKDVLAKFYFKIAIWHLKMKQIRKARSLFLLSLQNHFHIKSIFLYLSTFLGKNWISLLFKMLNRKIKKHYAKNQK